MTDKAIRMCDNKGFHLDLPNGVTVSVQLGPGNYCDSDARSADFNAPERAIARGDFWGSNTAECAAYITGSNLEWVGVPGFTAPLEDGRTRADDVFYDDVCGWMKVSDVLSFINRAARLVNPKANENSVGNRVLSDHKLIDYRNDSKIQEDERRIMNDEA